MSVELRPRVRYTDSRGVEREQASRWVEYRPGLPSWRPYAWRGQRNRLQAITRARVELGLAADAEG